MIGGQAGAVLLAVMIVSWLVYRHANSQPLLVTDNGAKPCVWGIWKFGLVQLGGIMGLNAAGWWVASLVARNDVSLHQMAFYGIANQLRNVATLIPSLVEQTSFAMLTEEGGVDFGGSDRVLAVSSVFASLMGILCAGVAIAIVPWVLYIYGHAYRGAELTCSIAIAIALIHMGSAPAACRLAIVSLRVTGIVNAVWAVFVLAAGTWLVPMGGAVAAVASFFAAHVLSMFMVLIWLKRYSTVPPVVIRVSFLNLFIASGLIAISWSRSWSGMQPVAAAAACASITGTAVFCLWRVGRAYGLADLRSLLYSLRGRFKVSFGEIGPNNV